jgi:hypothetical protein
MVGEEIIFILDAKNFSRPKESIPKYAKDQIFAYVATLNCKKVSFIFPYMEKEPVEDPGHYTMYSMKMTPEPDFLKNQTLEKIFDIISDSVRQLKS